MKSAKSIVLILFLSSSVNAQIDHYWSWNFNTSSALLSGAVVGGKPDVSSIYYNPALISKTTEESQLAVNASLFTIEWFNYENAFGQGFNLKKQDLQIQPRFISYTGDTKKGAKFEFAFFTRNSDDLTVLFNHSENVDILSRPEGDEVYTAELQYKTSYVDRWFGFGISDKSQSGRLSYGLSTFILYKDLRYEIENSMLAFSETDSMVINGVQLPSYVASYGNRESIKSWDGRISWKAGIHYQINSWGIGLALTTPSLQVIAGSKSSYELNRINIFDNSSSNPAMDSTFVSVQTGQSFQLKDPFSVSFGVEFNNPKNENAILFSMEYFHKITAYNFTNYSPSESQGTNSDNFSENDIDRINVFHGANSVLNFAFGYHYYINESISALGGFRTDFSNLSKFIDDNPTLRTIAGLNYDLYHVTFGGEFHIKKLDFVAGVEYSWAREDNEQQIINFSDPLEYIPDTGAALQGIRTNTMNINYNALSLFIGLTVNILTGGS